MKTEGTVTYNKVALEREARATWIPRYKDKDSVNTHMVYNKYMKI